MLGGGEGGGVYGGWLVGVCRGADGLVFGGRGKVGVFREAGRLGSVVRLKAGVCSEAEGWGL